MAETQDSRIAQVWLVWGVGPAESPLVREAEATDEWPEDALSACGLTADDVQAGYPPAAEGWCVEVLATEEDVDAATRHDAAVRGYRSQHEEVARG